LFVKYQGIMDMSNINKTFFVLDKGEMMNEGKKLDEHFNLYVFYGYGIMVTIACFSSKSKKFIYKNDIIILTNFKNNDFFFLR